MAVALGTVMVLLTWTLWLLAFAGLGLLPALLLDRSGSMFQVLRTALWWGLLGALVFSMAASLWFPLAGTTAALAGLAVLAILALPGVGLWRRRRPRALGRRPNTGRVLLIVTAAGATLYLAIAALGPVTNYDSGLYHLGAIRYAADFAAIPGLANLYFPFGYGTAHFPLAALMTNGPWGIEGYRLVNGLILAMAATDLALRAVRRKPGPGFFVLAVGLTATWIPMVALSDYWVTSPSQDSAALALCVVASAYLTEAVAGKRNWMSAASTTIVIATSLTLIRPTMGAYLIGVLAVLLILAVRRRVPLGVLLPPAALALGAGALALGVTTARDRILSGWFQYPLNLFAFDVPWQADDPTPVREATLGFHRNPDDLWNSVEGWNWVGPWIASRAVQWETYAMLALAVLAVVTVPWALRRSPAPRLGARILASIAPSALAVAVWWGFSPPSYRFAWGALFSLLSVPSGWAIWSMTTLRKQRVLLKVNAGDLALAALGFPVLAVIAFSALIRLDVDEITQPYDLQMGVALPVAIAPVTQAPVESIRLPSGLEVLQPMESDQCWWAYPLCTPAPDPRLAPIEGQWPNGFTAN